MREVPPIGGTFLKFDLCIKTLLTYKFTCREEAGPLSNFKYASAAITQILAHTFLPRFRVGLTVNTSVFIPPFA